MSKKGTKRDLFAVTQKAVIYDPREKKFLLTKCAEDQCGIEVIGRWDFAGGHIEYDEYDLQKALLREIHEELGGTIECSVQNPFIVQRRDYEGHKRIMIGVLVMYTGGELALSDGELVEYRWQTCKEIQKNKEVKLWLKELAIKAIEHIEKIN